MMKYILIKAVPRILQCRTPKYIGQDEDFYYLITHTVAYYLGR